MNLFWWIWTPLVALGLWIIVDFKAWTRFVQRNHRLDHEGKWDELDALIRKELHAFRPWVRLMLHFKAPGVLEGIAAGFYFECGRTEDSLRFAQASFRKARLGGPFTADILKLQALCLTELARYDEAREVVARLRSIGAASSADHAESFLCLNLGRLDEAIPLAERARQDPKVQAHGVIWCSHLYKGNHRQAVEVLLDPPKDVTSLYSAEQLHQLAKTGDGREMLESHRALWAGVMEPLRFLQAAYVYLDVRNAQELGFALDKAASVMGGSPALRTIYAELRACHCALEGDRAGVDRRLGEARELLTTFSKRTVELDFHRYSGRANLILGRDDAAVEAFEASLKLARHPMEKHAARYWLARGYEATGRREKAAELDREVAADGIASKFVRASPPPPSEPSRAS